MLLSPHKNICGHTFLNDMHVKVYLVQSFDLILSKKCWNRAWNKAETTSPAGLHKWRWLTALLSIDLSFQEKKSYTDRLINCRVCIPM